MKTRIVLLAVVCALCVGFVVVCDARSQGLPIAPPPRAKTLSEAEVRHLISQLGSDDHSERERATESLKRRPEAAAALLRANRTHESAEVKRRLHSILPVMMSQDGAAKRLALLPEYVKHRQFDRLVESLVVCREFITAEHDEHIRNFVKEIFADATNGKKHYFDEDSYPNFKSFAWHNRIGVSDTPTQVTRIASSIKGRGTGVIASDRVEGSGLKNSIALCNGDVDVLSVQCGVVIATGNVHIGSAVDVALVVCLGNVRMDLGDGVIVVAAGELTSAYVDSEATRNSIRERESAFFRNWMMYSTAEAGAELWSFGGVVGVKNVRPGSPLDKAGIKPLDIIWQIDGNPVRSIRSAIQLLCRAEISWGVCDLQLVRDGKPCEVVAELRKW